jgi:hypothetical protein
MLSVLCITIANMAAHCGPNAAKLLSDFYFQIQEDVASLGTVAEGSIPTITMEDGKFMAHWKVSNVNPNFVGAAEGDADGVNIPITVDAFIPNMTPAKTAQLNAAIGSEVILIVTDRNGKKWVIGEKGNGAILMPGAQTGDKNGYPIKFVWDAGRLPWGFGGTIPLPVV